MKMIFNYFRINVGSATLIVLIFFLVASCTSKPKETEAVDTKEEMSAPNESGKIDPTPGGIRIADLLANKEKYAGQTVRVKGKSVKVNNMIMNRNWIHLQDDSVAGENKDLTVTTTDNVSVGEVVTFEGIITLNKDFGSGYKYEIIMEDAKAIQ